MVPPILTEKSPGRVRGKDRAGPARAGEEGVRGCWVSLGRYLPRYGRDIEKGLNARFKARQVRSRTLNRLGVVIGKKSPSMVTAEPHTFFFFFHG